MGEKNVSRLVRSWRAISLAESIFLPWLTCWWLCYDIQQPVTQKEFDNKDGGKGERGNNWNKHHVAKKFVDTCPSRTYVSLPQAFATNLKAQTCTKEVFVCYNITISLELRDPNLFHHDNVPVHQAELHEDILCQVWCGRTQVSCTEPWPHPHSTPLGWTRTLTVPQLFSCLTSVSDFNNGLVAEWTKPHSHTFQNLVAFPKEWMLLVDNYKWGLSLELGV